MRRRPRILDGPRYATKVRCGPRHLIQMLTTRGEIEGDIGRTIARDVRQTCKTLHDMRRGQTSSEEPSISATRATRKCHESSKSAQARADSTRNENTAHSKQKDAFLPRVGQKKTTEEEQRREQQEERGRRIRVPIGTPYTHSRL